MNWPMLYGYLFGCESFMADKMGLDGTRLHYLAVQQAMVSIHSLVHSKTYSLTWQTDHGTPRRMTFKVLLNAKVAFSQALLSLHLKKKLLLLKHSYVYC